MNWELLNLTRIFDMDDFNIVDPVADWTHDIQTIRLLSGITSEEIPTDVVLAFIAVESNGDPHARRPGSQYHGLLQMGRGAAADVGLPSPSVLDGDGQAAIKAFLDYQRRYVKYHDWAPARMAICWKGGPGTCKAVNRRLRAGDSLREAVTWAEKYTLDDDDDIEVPNVNKYLDRFKAARNKYEGAS